MLRTWERGRFVFTDDFASLESHSSVRKGLCQLVREGILHRLARGIYYYAGVSGDINIKTSFVLPSEETIAYAVAERERIRIIPYGDQAAKKLGITGMSISTLKYLTDGAPRVINLAKGRKIYFNHTSEVKMFDFHNETMQMISSAIRALGDDMIGEREKQILQEAIRRVPDKEFEKDITIPPAWVQAIMLEIWNR
ncbi:MAG: DUF6088 family protein [Candidatus Cryptobacteroides sp.]